MKTLLLAITLMTAIPGAFATVDSHDSAYIVVQHIQSEEFFVERAPIIGCYGAIRGPQLVQFTSEYKATSNIGCGGPVFYDNINYLTCAKVISAKDSSDFMSYSEISLDISNCKAKGDPSFIAAVQTAARLNFPQKTGEVKLILIR